MPGGYVRSSAKKNDETTSSDSFEPPPSTEVVQPATTSAVVNQDVEEDRSENHQWKLLPSVCSWLLPVPFQDSEIPWIPATQKSNSDHPLLMIEYQRLSKPSVGGFVREPHPDAATIIVQPGNMVIHEGPAGCYWEPTDPATGDPYPLMEMIVAKPGQHYDNIVHIWRNPMGGELIGRPVDRSILKLNGPDSKLLYGPEVDRGTDRNGWTYGTSFDRLDEAREGGRDKRRLTDWCRSRLWKFGNDQVMPRDLWDLVPKVKIPGGGALQSVSSMSSDLSNKVQDKVVTLAGDSIICLAAQMNSIGEMVRNRGMARGKEAQTKKKEEEEKEKVKKEQGKEETQ